MRYSRALAAGMVSSGLAAPWVRSGSRMMTGWPSRWTTDCRIRSCTTCCETRSALSGTRRAVAAWRGSPMAHGCTISKTSTYGACSRTIAVTSGSGPAARACSGSDRTDGRHSRSRRHSCRACRTVTAASGSRRTTTEPCASAGRAGFGSVSPTGLPSNAVRDIEESRDGRLWFATDAGLAVLSPTDGL